MLALLLVLAGLLPACAADKPFTVVMLPDTQVYSEKFPNIFLAQTQWIKDQKNDLNIVCVVTLGEITDDNSDKQWRAADKWLECNIARNQVHVVQKE